MILGYGNRGSVHCEEFLESSADAVNPATAQEKKFTEYKLIVSLEQFLGNVFEIKDELSNIPDNVPDHVLSLKYLILNQCYTALNSFALPFTTHPEALGMIHWFSCNEISEQIKTPQCSIPQIGETVIQYLNMAKNNDPTYSHFEKSLFTCDVLELLTKEHNSNTKFQPKHAPKPNSVR
jgi:hypothetical protein